MLFDDEICYGEHGICVVMKRSGTMVDRMLQGYGLQDPNCKVCAAKLA